jgi:hypothetical protein
MTQRTDEYPSDAVAVTPSDTTAVGFCGLYVGGAGDVAIKGAGGVAVTFKAVPVGTLLKIQVAAVMATGTTATNIVGLVN